MPARARDPERSGRTVMGGHHQRVVLRGVRGGSTVARPKFGGGGRVGGRPVEIGRILRDPAGRLGASEGGRFAGSPCRDTASQMTSCLGATAADRLSDRRIVKATPLSKIRVQVVPNEVEGGKQLGQSFRA
jgi:hypothetical protein